MRVADHQQSQMFSYLSRETEMRKARSLRVVQFMVEEVLVPEEDDDTIPVKAL